MKRFFKSYFSGYNQPGGIRELLIIALPMIVSTASDGIMTFTDRIFLARLGSEQMNAAFIGGVSFQMSIFFFMGLTGYSTALVAQYFGAGENATASRAAFQAVLVTLFAWPLVVAIKPLTIYFFELAQISKSQISYQIEYLNILVYGGLFSMLRYTISCYFAGIGNTKVVMTATMTAMIVNVVMDYILIFGKFGFPSMGIRGAALATVLGSICADIILIAAYFSRFNRTEFKIFQSFRFDSVLMRKLVYFGSPAGIEMFLNFLAFFLIVTIFHSQGDVAATATSVMFNWDLMSFIPLVGIEVAVTSLVGRYMGAGQPDLAYSSALSGIKIGIFYSIIVLFLFVFIPDKLVWVFHPFEPSSVFDEATPIAIRMIRIATLYVLAEAMLVAFIGTLRGAGDTRFTMAASVTGHWVLVVLLWISCNVFHRSVEFSWFVLVMVFLAFCMVLFFRFKSGKWRSIKVI